MVKSLRFRIIMGIVLFVSVGIAIYMYLQISDKTLEYETLVKSYESVEVSAISVADDQGIYELDANKDVDLSYKSYYHILPLDLTDEDARNYFEIVDAKHGLTSTKSIGSRSYNSDKELSTLNIVCTYDINKNSLDDLYALIYDVHETDLRVDIVDYSLTYNNIDDEESTDNDTYDYNIDVTYQFYYYSTTDSTISETLTDLR